MTLTVQPKTVRVNGTDLTYIDVGTGDPVIFVHGGLSDFRSWMPQVEPFAARYRVVSYSRRYHYPNPGAAEAVEYLATQHRDDLVALLRTLDLAPAYVIGSSYGAYLSLLVAFAQPELVRALVLGEPPVISLLGPNALAAHMQRAIEPSRRAFASGRTEQAVRSFVDVVTGEGTFDRMPPPARQLMLENAPEFSLEVRTAPDRYFATLEPDDLKVIKTPTLLATGELSPLFLHQITDELERCLPAAQRGVIPRASHAMHSMNPEAYNQAVLTFLASH